MSTTAPKPATTPIPVQRSEPDGEALICPHLARPTRGPQCPLGYCRVGNLMLRVLDTGMQWQGLPGPQDANGTPALHDTTVDKVFAQGAEDGARWQACVARVRPRAVEKPLDRRGLQGDGPNPVAQKGAMASAMPATSTRQARRASPCPTTMATGWLPCPWPPSMRRRWCDSLMGCKHCNAWPKRAGWP